MHELSLLETMMETVLEQTAGHGAHRVHRIRLRVGELSGVVPEALEFAFQVVTNGTPAEGARLELELVPVVCHCAPCDEEFRPAGMVFLCPGCGELSTAVRQGKELVLESLEVS